MLLVEEKIDNEFSLKMWVCINYIVCLMLKEKYDHEKRMYKELREKDRKIERTRVKERRKMNLTASWLTTLNRTSCIDSDSRTSRLLST